MSKLGEAATLQCQHEHFQAKVEVGRLTNETGAVTDYMADVSVYCLDCNMPFRFKGVPIGMNPERPMVSADGLELRAPLVPNDGALRPKSKMPGFSVEGFSND